MISPICYQYQHLGKIVRYKIQNWLRFLKGVHELLMESENQATANALTYWAQLEARSE
jgi:hypothetical protein